MNFLGILGEHRKRRRPARWFRPAGFIVLGVLSGCLSDSVLLRENSSVALRSARFQARSDLACPKAEVTVLAEQEVPGAPWGYLYSDYRIQATGCEHSTIYTVKCRDGQLCDVTRESP